MTDSSSQIILPSSPPGGQTLPGSDFIAASPWSVFWVASIAVFLVSMDGTMLFAAFSALGPG